MTRSIVAALLLWAVASCTSSNDPGGGSVASGGSGSAASGGRGGSVAAGGAGGMSGSGGSNAGGSNNAGGSGLGGSMDGSGGAMGGTAATGGAGAGGAGGSTPDAATDTPAVDAGGDPGACPTPIISDGAMMDPKTCLVWQGSAGGPRTNVQAAKYCDGLTFGGYSDWRVPAPEELATWPGLKANSLPYVTNPTYIPATASDMDGCTGNAHSCNITEYNAGSIACGWQGVALAGPMVCVRGTARASSLATKYAAANCDACKPHVTGSPAEFKSANCLPFAN